MSDKDADLPLSYIVITNIQTQKAIVNTLSGKRYSIYLLKQIGIIPIKNVFYVVKIDKHTNSRKSNMLIYRRVISSVKLYKISARQIN